MNLLENSFIKNPQVLFLLIFTFFFQIAKAQNTEVLDIKLNGENISQAELFVTPLAKPTENFIVKLGREFPSGITIGTPSATTVKMGANGNQQELLPNTKHSIRITPKMERHKTIEGKVVHYVNNKPAGYEYRASGNKVYAKPPGTVFSVQVNGKSSLFETREGEIITVEEVKVKVNQQSQNKASDKNRSLTSSITATYKAGESKYFDGNETVLTYNTYDQALKIFQLQLQRNENSYFPDVEQIADDNMLLGELFLDNGDPYKSMTYFDKAVDYYYQLEFEEMSIAEAYLLKGEAYFMIENYNKVDELANMAIDLIEPYLNINLVDYKYAYEDGDQYLMEDIAIDLYYNYDFLGWAYELKGDEVNKVKYYGYADKYYSEY